MEDEVKKITENINKFKEDKISPKNLILNLYHTGLKMSEVLVVCKNELGSKYNEEIFREIAIDIKIDELPSNSYINDKGFTIIRGSINDY